MTKVQHTPGPWHLGTNGDRCAKNHAVCAGATVIAKVYGRGYPAGEGWSERSQADACLIVAAPKLLLELMLVLDHIEARHSVAGVDAALRRLRINEARAAIADATGRSA